MKPFAPPIDHTHFATNTRQFGLAALHPTKILLAQTNLWRELKVLGARQKTAQENFLIIGEPYEENGVICSQIFNQQILNPYTPPALAPLHSSDTCPNVKAMGPTGLVWQHMGDDEGAVRAWYAGIGAEAKDGRILFNLHYKDAWEALFHEPVHEAAPGGGIGTAPRWIYEGYCEIFAKRLAESMGFPYSIEAGPYADCAREVEKLISFADETYVARAYFTNDKWSYGLLAPLWYAKVMGHDISPSIATFLPKELIPVPGDINDVLTALKRRSPRPDWYKRWVQLFGRSNLMPEPTLTPTLGPPRGGGRGGGINPLPTPVPQVTQPQTAKPFSAKIWAADR